MSGKKLSVEIAQEHTTVVNKHLDDLATELAYLVELSIDARKRLVKMGRRNVDFVDRGYRHAETNPEFLSGNTPFEEFKKDVELANWLRKLEKKMGLISERVKDTAMLAEAEAFQTARLYYNSVKASARTGDEIAEQIARDLGVHYKRRAAKEETPPTPPAPEQEEAKK